MGAALTGGKDNNQLATAAMDSATVMQWQRQWTVGRQFDGNAMAMQQQRRCNGDNFNGVGRCNGNGDSSDTTTTMATAMVMEGTTAM